MYTGLNNLGLTGLASSFSPSNLFTNGEGGAHFETYDPQSLLRRRNQLTYSEFPNGTADLTSASGGFVTASAIAGFDGAIAIGRDGVTNQLAVKSMGSAWAGATGVMSVIVQMDDGLGPPVFSGSASSSTNDFALFMGAILVPSGGNYTVTDLGGGLYRVTGVGTVGGTASFGVQKYGTNSARTFKTTAWHFEPNVSTFTSYQKVTDWTTEYMAAALESIGMWQDSTGTTPVTAVEQPVGLWMDGRLGQRWGRGAPITVSSATLSAGAIDNGNGTYTIPAGGNIRFFFPLASLDNGASYDVTLPGFSIAGGTASSDLCDTPGVTIAGGTTGNVRYIASRSTYDATFRFVDVVAGTGATVTMSAPTLSRVGSGVLYHATQSGSTKRPMLSARVNLLTKTEQFDDAVWTKTRVGGLEGPTITANAVADPNGNLTADLVDFTNSNGMFVGQVFTISAGVSGKVIVYAYAPLVGGAPSIRITTNNTAAWNTGISQSFPLSNGWNMLELSGTLISSGTSCRVMFGGANADGTADASIVGKVYLWGADLRTSDDAAKNIPAYQRVNTSTDYDTVGFPHYLEFDGVDDCLQTGSIDFTAFDKMTVWTGATKNSDAAVGIVAELSPASGANSGSFYVAGPGGTGAATWAFSARGTSSVTSSATAVAPDSAVICGTADLSAPLLQIRRNGVLATQSSSVLGGGTFGNWNLNIGGRNNGASFDLNGRLTSLTVRGSLTPTDTSTISKMERYAGGLMKISF